MSEREKIETAREARQAIASRSAGSGTAAREEALRRYLGAAEYHDLKSPDAAEKHPAKDPGQHPA